MGVVWLYNIAGWASFALVVGTTVATGLAGLFALRGWVSRLHNEHNHNEIVSYFLASVVLLYGVMVGLIAVAVWQQYSDAEEKVTLEASALAALYRDVASYPEPYRTRLENDLKAYTRNVIENAWPLQQKRLMPVADGHILWQFQTDLNSFQPDESWENVIQAETLRAYNRLVELRSLRVHNVGAGLSRAVWVVVALGATLTLAVSWFFKTRTFSVHFWMVTLTSVLLGSIIWLLVVMDHPFLGAISIQPSEFDNVYRSLMSGQN